MNPIATYLFFDLETTDLPNKGEGIVQITELGMIAIKRLHLLNMEPDEEPRVQYKIRMCFNPQKKINKESAELSGLNNNLLKSEAEFNMDTFNTINSFINCLEKPVCLIAHCAFNFHFPILKYHFKRMQVTLSDDIICTDSIYAFYDILEPEYKNNQFWNEFETDVKNIKDEMKEMQTFSQLRRERFFGNKYPAESYKLKDVYERVTCGPYLKTNRSENQCTMMMKIAITRAGQFVEWVDKNHCPFSEVPIIIM